MHLCQHRYILKFDSFMFLHSCGLEDMKVKATQVVSSSDKMKLLCFKVCKHTIL